MFFNNVSKFVQISDAVLDACLEQDKDSKVACETCTKTGMVMVFGEITTSAKVDYEKIVRDTCREIGFISEEVGLDCDTCKVNEYNIHSILAKPDSVTAF